MVAGSCRTIAIAGRPVIGGLPIRLYEPGEMANYVKQCTPFIRITQSDVCPSHAYRRASSHFPEIHRGRPATRWRSVPLEAAQLFPVDRNRCGSRGDFSRPVAGGADGPCLPAQRSEKALSNSLIARSAASCMHPICWCACAAVAYADTRSAVSALPA